MSEVMTCMPFEQLMNWVLEEKKTKGTVSFYTLGCKVNQYETQMLKERFI